MVCDWWCSSTNYNNCCSDITRKNHKIDVEDDVKVSFNGYNKTGQPKLQMILMKKS